MIRVPQVLLGCQLSLSSPACGAVLRGPPPWPLEGPAGASKRRHSPSSPPGTCLVHRTTIFLDAWEMSLTQLTPHPPPNPLLSPSSHLCKEPHCPSNASRLNPDSHHGRPLSRLPCHSAVKSVGSAFKKHPEFFSSSLPSWSEPLSSLPKLPHSF